MGRGDKQLTALLLNPKDMSIIQFGSKARKTFADMCDNPKAEPCVTRYIPRWIQGFIWVPAAYQYLHSFPAPPSPTLDATTFRHA